MTLFTQRFEPDNIMRHVAVYSKDGQTQITVDWHSLFNMLAINNMPVDLYTLQKACEGTIQTHICDAFRVPKNNPRAAKTMPYMVSLVIFETVRMILTKEEKEVVSDNNEPAEESFQKSNDGKLIVNTK